VLPPFGGSKMFFLRLGMIYHVIGGYVHFCLNISFYSSSMCSMRAVPPKIKKMKTELLNPI